MSDGKVLHASHDGIHVLRYIGDIRYILSTSIERFLDEVFTGPGPAGFVIDLTETDSIDSTNLGLLARIAIRMQASGAARVTLVSNRAEINSVLTSMALDEVFDIVDDSGLAAGEAEELPQADADRETLARTLIDAHRALMELSEHNREMFRDVLVALEKNSAGG
ncbi:MAG TPA: STAS domain-containing protein [Gammaproteobacteria bacterium]|nr:STAS domain-containing protein [Gammaproteobacteria bacterium]